jgi:uncharacterized protein
MQCTNCGNSIKGTPKFCPSCGSPVDLEKKGGKVSAEPEESASSRAQPRRVAMVLFPIVIIAGLAIFYAYVNPSVHAVIQKQPIVAPPADYDSNFVSMVDIPVREEGPDLVFSLAALKRNRLIRFEYAGGKTMRYIMAYVAPDGRLVTAMSISDHCGSTEFRIKNNKIYCARCPSYWDIMTMEAYACCAKYYPDPIPSRVIGDEVHVAKDVITNWAGRL